MKNKFLFWLSLAVAVLLAVYLGVRISMVLMGAGGPLSSIKKISVHSSNGEVAGLISRLGIEPGVRHVDLDQALTRISADPDVASAGVRRMPNGEIKVRAKMRVVIASWTDGEHYYPLDDTGSPINRPLPERPVNTLVFSGQVPGNISSAIAALKQTPGLFYRTDRMEFVEGRRWDIFLLNGVRIMLPEENFASAAEKIEKLNKQNMILDRQITLLDLRDPARVLVKLK